MHSSLASKMQLAMEDRLLRSMGPVEISVLSIAQDCRATLTNTCRMSLGIVTKIQYVRAYKAIYLK